MKTYRRHKSESMFWGGVLSELDEERLEGARFEQTSRRRGETIWAQSDEDCVEDGEEREPPGDSVDDDGLDVDGGELVDDGAEKEEVDERPGEEDPIG